MGPKSCALTLILAFGAVVPAGADPYIASFARVADTGTAIPGGTGTFAAFDPFYLSSSAAGVAFVADGPGGQRGLYSNLGGSLGVVADLSTPVPGNPSQRFGDFLYPSVSNGQIAFLGRDPSRGPGLYLASGGVINVVADGSTPLPGGGTFGGSPSFSLSNGEVAFIGRTGGTAVFRASGGSISLVADDQTLVPGTTDQFFRSFGGVALSDGSIAFTGRDQSGNFGVFADTGSGLEVVANTDTILPGGVGRPFGVTEPTISGDSVAFTGFGDARRAGVFVGGGGAIRTVATTDTSAPGGGTFEGFGESIISGDQVLFAGFQGGARGLYLGFVNGQAPIKVVAPGDLLDGKLVSSVSLPRSWEGGGPTFLASFADGSQGIYSATVVPEPSAVVLTAIGLGMALAAHRRRRSA